jgi:hypothetical protein
MAQPRTKTLTDCGITAPSRAGARELGASTAAWPRKRRMKDRAGSSGIAVMPAKNMGPNCLENQIKKTTCRLDLNLWHRGACGAEPPKNQ